MPVSPIVPQLSEEVADALEEGRPVVALESTIISHGLPQPDNLAAAHEFESIVRSAGVTPATIAVLDGQLKAGLAESELERIATDVLAKLTVRDLPMAMGLQVSGATTVAATSDIAHRAGIRVFATGGLGGVHRGAAENFDESADLTILSQVPITVVSAGVKSILDISATLERLETLNVPVLGYRTSIFPSFWLTESPFELDWSVPGPEAVAAVMAARDGLGLPSGIVVANPIDAERQLDPALHETALAEALSLADERGLSGKEVTPFLLQTIVELTAGESLRVNLDIARNNIAVACDIARAWAELN